jgi:hypothetical protein
VDDGLDTKTRRSSRTRNPPKLLTFKDFQAARNWQEMANNAFDMELFTACQTEAKEPPINLSAVDPSPFMPPPMGIRSVLKMSDLKVREAWLRAYKKEIKTLIDAKTFALDIPKDGEPVIPTMETNKVKIKSDGSLDKLKCRIVVRGDLQDTAMEDSWSPTAPFRSLKMFLADAARNKCRVHQLDFVGAFLQANVRGRIFVSLPKVYGDIWPEFKDYCGKPLRLIKSMYGMTYSGKYWYLDLKEWLHEEGFTQSRASPCFFCKVFPDGSYVKLIVYVDDKLFFGNNEATLQEFKDKLSKRFDVEFLGQAHWYLSARIHQDADFNVTLDQARYCKAIVNRFLEKAGAKKKPRFHSTILPADFVPSAEDCSKDEESAKTLQEEYGIDFASCVGALLYLSYTRPDITYAVVKFAKYTRRPGVVHMEALLHLLRYLRDNMYLGLKFYSDITMSPITRLLSSNGNSLDNPLCTFTDSSWNDDIDTGRSSGCFMIFYMGGVVEHSSNMPDPVALSSAEAEYNEACLACMATAHLKQFLEDLESPYADDKKSKKPIQIFIDNRSAVDMGASFKDTQRTRHMMRRFHYVREGVESNQHVLIWIPTNAQLADIGTKILGRALLDSFKELIFVKVPE